MASKSPKKPIAVLAALALVSAVLASLTLSAGAQTPAPISAETFTLTILHNNDGESKLLPDEDSGFPGVARFAAQMKLMQTAARSTATASSRSLRATTSSLRRNSASLWLEKVPSMTRSPSAGYTTLWPSATTTSTWAPR